MSYGWEVGQEDAEPLTEEECRQLEEADAALLEHGLRTEAAELPPRARIRLAPYAKVLRDFNEGMEARRRALAESRTPPVCWPSLPPSIHEPNSTPEHLHAVLDALVETGNEDIISWARETLEELGIPPDEHPFDQE